MSGGPDVLQRERGRMAGAEVLGGVGISKPAEIDDSLDPGLPCRFCERCGRVGLGADEVVFVPPAMRWAR